MTELATLINAHQHRRFATSVCAAIGCGWFSKSPDRNEAFAAHLAEVIEREYVAPRVAAAEADYPKLFASIDGLRARVDHDRRTLKNLEELAVSLRGTDGIAGGWMADTIERWLHNGDHP